MEEQSYCPHCGRDRWGNTGSNNSGVKNTGEFNSGSHNTGWYNRGNGNTGCKNYGDHNVGWANRGNFNIGTFNYGNYSIGFFNTKPQKINVFDKPTEYTLQEFHDAGLAPALAEFEVVAWGKDLQPYSIKWSQAWERYWAETWEQDRKKIINMPNFDAAMFKQITGIDLK